MKPSMKEQYELYSKYVPEISSDDLNFFNNKINTIVHQIIIKQRTSIMMRLVKLPYPSPPLPPKDKLYDSLQEVSPDNFLEVSPQQVQSITILINHLYKNPQTFAEAIKAQQDIPNNDCFLLFNTSIPAIYGFFSSWELNYYASSFYCALIDISPRHIAREALIPYYCSPCTHRFIESIYNIFGKQFCHDIRYNSPKPQPLIIERYLSLFINSINKSFPFLPQSHQFILKFMGTRGWTSRSIIDFFVNRFTLPQLLQYVKSTAFKNHYKQLLQFSTLIKCDDDNFKSIISVINNSKSIFQIPSCFSDFDFPYFDILITKLDISLIIESLKLIKEGIPKNLQPFLKPTQYFQSINFRPFFIRVYIKSPIQSDILLNVRNVIFNEPINIYEKITNNEFKRRFRQIKDKANRISVSPITFIKMNTKIFGRKITKEFEDFIYYELIEELEKNADIFEKYLLHLMAFKSVFNWKLIVHKYCKIILKPYAEKEIKKFLTWSNRNKKNLAKLTEKMTICKNTQFSLIVQHLLPSFLTKT